MTACPPLRYSVPAIIFLLGSLLSIGSYIHERNLSNAQLEALVNRYVQFIGNQISGVAAYLIADEDISGLRQQVASLGADPILKYAPA